jgi:leucyl aminopeptidase (aminopeptidase T)
VPVHYYRATNDPGDAKGAAAQFYRFLKEVHDRVKRPLWVTEWNNGANWTKAPDPNPKQQKEAIAEMIKMLDETPFVERYALYNWVEDVRHLVSKDESLTPAGEVYRDRTSPQSFTQPKGEK